VAVAVCGIAVAGGAARALAAPWPWPASGPVIRGFEAPASPYATGHRGIDIAIAFGSDVRSPAAGVVKFAGRIGGSTFVSIDHGAGLESTYSWVSEALVGKGDALASGARIALSGTGHPDGGVPHLHFGVKRDGIYIDPMSVLATPDVAGVIHLAPISTASG
jgi:murein DD-endopeptidase MepM/ murein hydrolase activator NlpD